MVKIITLLLTGVVIKTLIIEITKILILTIMIIIVIINASYELSITDLDCLP